MDRPITIAERLGALVFIIVTHAVPMSILALLALGLVLALGCGPSRPPVVTPKPPVDPAIYDHDCRVLYHDELGRDPEQEGLYGCEKRLAARKADGVTPVETQEDFRAWLNSTPEGQAYDAAQAEAHLPRIVRDFGRFVKLEDGSPFVIAETSEFQALRLQLEAHNDALETLLNRDQEAGFNTIRVFGMFDNPRNGNTPQGGLGRLHPQDFGGDYWPGLRALCKKAARKGLYVEFVVFADTTVVMPNKADQLAHWANVQGLSDITNLLVEAVNEADQAINRTDALAELQKPVGIFASHGSNGSDAFPVKPYWDYASFHVSSSEWQRKVGHNAWEVDFQGPILTNETARYPDRESQAYRAEDAARGAYIFVAGANFHSAGGKYGEAWNNIESEAVKAFIVGLFDKFPGGRTTGPYRHEEFIQQEQDQGLLRIYLMGYDLNYLVKIRK